METFLLMIILIGVGLYAANKVDIDDDDFP